MKKIIVLLGTAVVLLLLLISGGYSYYYGWLSVMFWLVSLFSIPYCSEKLSLKEKNTGVLNWSLILVSLIYFIAESIVAIITLFYNEANAAIMVAIQLLLLFFFLVLLMVSYKANTITIDSIGKQKNNSNKLQEWKQDVKYLIDQSSNDNVFFCELCNLQYLLSSSATSLDVSNEIDNKISYQIGLLLKHKNESDLINNELREIEELLSYRNHIIKKENGK